MDKKKKEELKPRMPVFEGDIDSRAYEYASEYLQEMFFDKENLAALKKAWGRTSDDYWDGFYSGVMDFADHIGGRQYTESERYWKEVN